MSVIVSTIVIPLLGQPSLLRAALKGLVKHSFYKHRIVVIKSDVVVTCLATNADFRARMLGWDIIGNKRVQRYDSVETYLDEDRHWLRENNIEVYDISREISDFLKQHATDVKIVEGGADIAFKNNYGLSITDTEWTIPNWDADFYPAPNWDKPLIEAAQYMAHKTVIVPTHVQPQFFDSPPDWKDVWVDSRAAASNRLAIPTTHSVDGCSYVTENEFIEFCASIKRPRDVIAEKPGVREKLHWVPALLRTDEVKSIGGYAYIGAGYDIEFDNRLGENGFMKYGYCDSFILHKGYPFIP